MDPDVIEGRRKILETYLVVSYYCYSINYYFYYYYSPLLEYWCVFFC